jgi:hypothetical protein
MHHRHALGYPCVVTSDILPQTFVDYLADEKHDTYRNSSGTLVQVDGYLGFREQF